MRDPNEYQSLDELFRNTFDNLPPTSSANGWDKPSEAVWQHVQQQIKPAKGGWTAKGWTLLAAFFVTLSIGLYFYAKSSDTTTLTPEPATIVSSVPATAPEQQESSVVANLPEPGNNTQAVVTTPKNTAKTTRRALKNKKEPTVNSTQERIERQLPAGNQPLPGSHSKPPNTPLKLGREKQQDPEKQTLITPLPLPIEYHGQVPDISVFIQKINANTGKQD